MIVADTNVWARAHLNDDPTQAKKARKALAMAQATGGVFVPLLVLAELAWVLRSKWERARVLQAIEGLLQTHGVILESPLVVRAALESAREGGTGGFVDHLIAQVGFATGAREIITFDNQFGKAARVRRLK